MVDWSIVMGLALGIGMPAMGGVFMLVRMENRVTNLETSQVEDKAWRTAVTAKLDSIARDLNRMMGAHDARGQHE